MLNIWKSRISIIESAGKCGGQSLRLDNCDYHIASTDGGINNNDFDLTPGIVGVGTMSIRSITLPVHVILDLGIINIKRQEAPILLRHKLSLIVILLYLLAMGIDFTVFKGSKSGDVVEDKGHREPGPTEVLVKISHCGVCGTDEHYRHYEQGLGHEGVGTIIEVGSSVHDISDFRVGDRVGMGWFHKFCGHCKSCVAGERSLLSINLVSHRCSRFRPSNTMCG